MIEIPAQALSTVEKWPLSESGLSTRIVNACQAEKIRTVGDLRKTSPATLLRLPHFGIKSMESCRVFHSQCDRLSAGTLRIQSLREWMQYFISCDGYEVISSRYGFFRTDSGVGRKFFTLQDIANRTGRSRERIRQVEETSIRALAHELPQAGLMAAAHKVSSWLTTREGSAAWRDIDAETGWKEWDGASPASVAYYLGELFPDILTLRKGYASQLSSKTVKGACETASTLLQSLSLPISLPDLARRIQQSMPDLSRKHLHNFLQLELQHATEFICTVDGCYCGPRILCLTELCKDHLERHTTAVHFREVARQVNLRLAPEQSVGAGTVLQCLGQAGFRRRGSGLYTIHRPR